MNAIRKKAVPLGTAFLLVRTIDLSSIPLRL
jgi:hypothetical protein